MTHIVMAYIVVAYMVMAYIVMAYIVMAYIGSGFTKTICTFSRMRSAGCGQSLLQQTRTPISISAQGMLRAIKSKHSVRT